MVGRPPYKPSNEDRRKVFELGKLCLRDEDIARIIGIGESTLKKHLQKEVTDGRAFARETLAKTAWQMATDGKNPTMTIFMCKVQLHWKDTDRLEEAIEIKLPPINFKVGEEPK